MLFERIDLREVSRAVGSLGVDGWLIYDFHGANPVAKRVVGYGGMATRRLFVWIPASGEPVALVHRIEMQPMEGFPGVIVPYSTWAELGSALGKVISGKRAAMEISPADAVPYLDRVPFGVVDLIRGLGAEVVESSDLVSRFAARWSAQELEDHLAAAEILASVARSNIRFAQQRVGSITEHELQARVIAELEQNGLKVADPPIVGFGPNSALPHYEPSAANSVALGADEVILLDLWAGKSLETVFADQTWMGFSGATVPRRVAAVWEAVRGARDAVLDLLRQGYPRKSFTGFDLDVTARSFIESCGFGDAFTHRTGHSIDIDLHGSGPHLDSYETEDRRALLPGVGFSVEPGVYLEGEFGVRSEVNVFLGVDGPRISPSRLQDELFLAE